MRFSIIIPMYNAENTLDKCLSSIVSQSFRDYQVLIVDDSSGDGSLAVAEQYAARDARFTVFSIGHGGPGAARNAGLDRAEGDYILHMDADDCWIRDDLLQELENRILTQPADVYMYQTIKVTEAGTVLKRYAKPPFEKPDQVLELKEVYQDLVSDGQALASACNKCVRRALLLENGIRFREDVLGEDIDWVFQLFSHVQTICLMNLQAYAYTQRNGNTRSSAHGAHNDLVMIVDDWGRRSAGNMRHKEAVAGLAAFQYVICMGFDHELLPPQKGIMRRNTHLLRFGLDPKSKLAFRFYRIFGYNLTAAALRLYLTLRRIW